MGFPKLVKPYTASFENVGTANERLKLQWTYPLGVYGAYQFLVGTDCFLEDPTLVSMIPDEQLLASLSMSAILAGEVLPGTGEFLDAVSSQGTKNFQTIVGEVRLKPETVSFRNPQPVDDLTIGPSGTVFDIVFQKGTGSNTKTIRTDAWSISQYSNRIDSVYHSVYVVAGALHKQFGFKKSELGAAESQNRTDVINWISSKEFWI